MRRRRRCPKCDGIEILHVRQVADCSFVSGATDDLAHVRRVESSAMRVARVPLTSHRHAPSREAAGLVEAYVCEGCGYTEFYTREPKSIPVDGRVIQRLSRPDGDGPYR